MWCAVPLRFLKTLTRPKEQYWATLWKSRNCDNSDASRPVRMLRMGMKKQSGQRYYMIKRSLRDVCTHVGKVTEHAIYWVTEMCCQGAFDNRIGTWAKERLIRCTSANLHHYLKNYQCPPCWWKSTMQCKWDITQRKRQLNSEQNRENIVALPTQTASNPSDVSFRPPSAHLPTLRYFWKHSLSFRLPSAIASRSKMHNGKPESYPNRRTLQFFSCMGFFFRHHI